MQSASDPSEQGAQASSVNSIGLVDLHVHTTASDGSLSPLEVVHAAKEAGLKAIAITDHDTAEGAAELLHCPVCNGIEVIAGIEVSADCDGGTMHILGYLIKPDDEGLRNSLRAIQEARAGRNIRIVERLRELGIDITMDEVRAVAGDGQVGRPHIARVMVEKGAVRAVNDAFDKYLAKGGPAYISRFRLKPAKAIEMILQAGGVAVLAHPFTLKEQTEAELDTLLQELKQAGLAGVEVLYPEHSAEQVSRYERLARRHGLVMTGGTDFHGESKPENKLGKGSGGLRVPYTVVEELKAISRQ